MTEPKPSRPLREQLTKRATADIMRAHMVCNRFRQTTIVRRSGISRTHLHSVLSAEANVSFFLFLELSDALKLEDADQLLRDVLKRREELFTEAKGTSVQSPP